ncbi:MAG: serine/threonine-protein kinase PknK [Sandaracinaceae bacterium]
MASASAQADDRIGPYRLEDTIGRGGMGVVFRARDLRDGSIVALKTVFTDRAEHAASIRLEIGTLARLRHRGVVRIHEHGVHDGAPWYAMELLEGRTLRGELTERSITSPDIRNAPVVELPTSSSRAVPRMPLIEALRLTHRICEPLAFLHGEGVVHRDLKPSNVFLRDGGDPVLVDFGLVQRFEGLGRREQLHEAESPPAGTYQYMSPEQLCEGVIDPRADIYALGCLLYELVVGQPPFRGTSVQLTLQHIQAVPARPSTRVGGIPPALDELLMRMLAKRPADRIGYAVDVARRLEEISLELGESLPAVESGARPYLYRSDIEGRAPALTAAMRAVADPAVAVVLLRGRSGVGKTRMATELARSLRANESVVIAKGSCQPLSGGLRAGGGAPLHALRSVLQQIGDHCRARGAKETARVLGHRAAVLSIYEPSLDDLVDRSARAPMWLPTAAASRERLLSWLAETLARFAQSQRLLVFVDDVQWADEVTLSFLQALAAGTVEAPKVKFVCTSRIGTGADRELLSAPGTREVGLEPLDDVAVGSVIAQMLGRTDPPDELLTAILRRAEGNPLHVSEYLHAAVERNLLARSAEGGWLIRAQDAERVLPVSIGALIASRVDVQDSVARDLLELVTTIGQDAPLELVIAACETSENEVVARLGELISRDLLDETRAGVVNVRHDALSEAIVGRLDPERRRVLHGRVARALERGRSHDPQRLAVHLEGSGEPARAAPYYLAAGVAAQRMTASALARELFERGFDLERQTGIAITDDLSRRQVELAYGAALYGAGRLDEADRALRACLAKLGTPLPDSRNGWMRQMGSDLLAHLRGEAGPTGRDATTELALLGLENLTSIQMARADALSQVGMALLSGRLAARVGEGGPAALGHSRMALLTGLAGLEAISDRYMARARSASSGQPLPSRCYVNESLVHLARARWDRLERAVESAVQACRAAGDFQAEVQVRLFSVGAAVVRGRPDEGLAASEDALLLTERHGYALERTHLLGNRAVAWVLKGDVEAAREAIDAHRASMDDLADPVASTLGSVLAAALALLESPAGSAGVRAYADEAFDRLGSVPGGSPGYVVHHTLLPLVFYGLAERGDDSALEPAGVLTRALFRQSLAQPAARPITWLLAGIRARLQSRRSARWTLSHAADRAADLDMSWTLAAVRFELARLEGQGDDGPRRALEAIGARFPPFYAVG